MWVVYTLLFFFMYIMHCKMASLFLTYYMAKPYPFHLNLFRWNQDVKLAVDTLVS